MKYIILIVCLLLFATVTAVLCVVVSELVNKVCNIIWKKWVRRKKK